MLWKVTGDNDTLYPSIFNTATMTPTQPLYNDCAAAMWEMRELSDIYVKYRNLGAFTVNCTENTPYLAMSGEYKEFSIISEIASMQPYLIGCFENGKGQYAFTVVNMTELKELSDSEIKFKLSENMKVTLYRNAKPEELMPDSEGYYKISLEWGEGVFVTIG